MKKKKGASLILVVAMFAILSIIILSIMAMTTMGVTLRKSQNTRIENFYGADSGLEIAYKISEDIVLKAIEEGNKEVEKKAIELGKALNYEEENYYFKLAYAKHINDEYKIQVDNKVNASNTNYDEYQKNGGKIIVSITKEEKIMENIKVNDEQKEVLKFYDVEMRSNFKDKNNKDREVEATHKIETPNYGELYIAGVAGKGDYSILDYVIAVDGNLYITNGGDLDIYGDIWVNGREVDNDKFGRGIHFNENPGALNTDWKGKISTKGTFNISGAVKFTDSIYANDIYIKNDLVKPVKNIIETEGDINVYNDLIFKAENTELIMNNYYGLNDIKDEFSHKLNEQERSSAVIIESNDFGEKSYIKTIEDMYVLGTAYLNGINEIDALKNYQSGESIVINRNTTPYTSRDYEKDYIYKYNKPIHMVDQLYDINEKQYKKLSVPQKSKLVMDYYEKNQIINNSEEEKKFSGISANQFHTAGVAYGDNNNDDKLYHAPNLNNTAIIDVKNKQKEFANEVFFRGTNEDAVLEDFWNKVEYEDINVEKSFNWNEIERLINMKEIYNSENGENNSEPQTKKILERKEIFKGKNGQVAKFETTETIGALIGTDIAPTMHAFKLNIIFNDSSDELIIENSNPKTPNVDNDGKVNINVNDSMANPMLIVSKGPITIKGEGGWNINTISFTEEDLSFTFTGSSTLGNFTTEGHKFELNEIFKKFLSDMNLGGVIGDNILNERESQSYEDILIASDLIKRKNWKLIK